MDEKELLKENIEILQDAIQDYKLVITLLKEVIAEQKAFLRPKVIVGPTLPAGAIIHTKE